MLGLSSVALANSSRIPASYINRPLTLPSAVMRLDGGPRWPDYDAQLKHIVLDNIPDQAYLNPGISFGLTDDFELGFVFPIQISPDSDLHDPRAYLLYRLEGGELTYGIFGQVRVGLRDQSALLGGVPLYYRLSPNVRLETGGFAQFTLGNNPRLDLIAPVYFTFQLSNRFYLGPEAGLGLYGVFDDDSGIATPIGGFLGYTIGDAANPLGDLYGRMRLTDLPDGALELMFGFEFYFDL